MVRYGLLRYAYAVMSLPRRIAASLLNRAQNTTGYRFIGRVIKPRIFVFKANEKEMAEVQAFFNPDESNADSEYNSAVTNYVAKHRRKIVGFVQLVRHPESHFPWVGHWLFSLYIWSRYRGLGIGEILTRRVISQAIAEHAKELLLVVYPDNVKAISLYEKLGFQKTVIPSLESMLEAEKQQNGRRRIAMRNSLKSE